MFSIRVILYAAALLAPVLQVRAGFASSSYTNIVQYWGQNSYGQSSGSLVQQDLAYYCQNLPNVDTFVLAFMTSIVGSGGEPELNFASSGNACSTFPGTALLDCPQISSDIATCQQTYGKTVLLSIGGSTYNEGGFSSSDNAIASANHIWAMFGPVQPGSEVLRPFGNSVVDGFDFDFESTVQNTAPFANQLRTLMDSTGQGSRYLLTAAPQCPYPDAADNSMLNGAVSFDAIFVQFYNNYCGLQSYVPGTSTQNNFNFATWDNWAKTVSKNPNVKVLLGVPANTGAAGSGYESNSGLASIINYCKQFNSFGGVMMWDATQANANDGFTSGAYIALTSSSKRLMTRT